MAEVNITACTNKVTWNCIIAHQRVSPDVNGQPVVQNFCENHSGST